MEDDEAGESALNLADDLHRPCQPLPHGKSPDQFTLSLTD